MAKVTGKDDATLQALSSYQYVQQYSCAYLNVYLCLGYHQKM